MNTTVPYKRPSHRSKYGHYVSRTEFKRQKYLWVVAKIDLVWFDHTGWYYVLEVEIVHKNLKVNIETESSPNMLKWPKGIQVANCAQEAGEALAKLCQKYHIRPPKLDPYILAKRY